MPRWKSRKGAGAVARREERRMDLLLVAQDTRREAAQEARAAAGEAVPRDPAAAMPWPRWATDAVDGLAEGAGVSRRMAGAVVGVALHRARCAAVQRDLDHERACAALAAGRSVHYQPAPVPPLTAGSRTRLARAAQAVAAYLPEAAQAALDAVQRGARGFARIEWLAFSLAAGAAAACITFALHP